MQVISNLDQWIALRKGLSNSLGFVPTMGNLHAGHASLFTASTKENTYTIASLFINPTQFTNSADFIHYPRTLEADLKLMTEAGVDFCLLPSFEQIYADNYTYQIQENKFSQVMEGKHRPGHFNGVLTIVLKLLNLIRPKTAYFGEKDYQQYLLIQAMVNALFLGVNIQACPTIREASGLAYSSRNNRLNKEQRTQAEIFAHIFQQNKPCEIIIEELTAQGIQVDYINEYQNRRFAAVLIGDIRLIDNYLIP